MVDRLNPTPDAVSPYKINEAAKSDDDKEDEEKRKKRDNDKFKKQTQETTDWYKLQGGYGTLKRVKMRKAHVRRLILRNAKIQQQRAVLIVDILLVNNQVLHAIEIVLSAMQDILKIKNFKIGDALPIDEIIKEEEFIAGIPIAPPPKSPKGGQIYENHHKGVFTKLKLTDENSKINFLNIFIYVFILIVILILIFNLVL
jgi:hypothetical protein